MKDPKTGKQISEVAQERLDKLKNTSQSAKNLRNKDKYKQIPEAQYGPKFKK